MVNPELVLLAIQAGVKLGRKVYDVLVDKRVEAPLMLPLGPTVGLPQEADAIDFFDQNPGLLLPGGPYEKAAGDREALVKAYSTIRRIDSVIDAGGLDPGAGTRMIIELQEFEQHKAGYGPNSPWQRILGTVVEIGIDYFAANPQAIGRDSSARRVVATFLAGIDDIDFAEGEPIDFVQTSLTAALQALGDNSALITHDRRLSVLLGGVTHALRQDIEGVSLGELQRRGELFERITSSILRAGAGAVADNPDLFVGGDGKAKDAVRSTMSAILDGIRDNEDLFSNAALEELFTDSLHAVSQNATLLTNDKVLQAIIGNTVAELTKGDARMLFSAASVEAITRAALETVAENSETLLDPKNPQQQRIAHAVAAMAQGLASELAGPGSVKDLFSTAQLIHLTEIVFDEVARHPEKLLGEDGQDPSRTALAQILGSVATALGDNPISLVNGETLIGVIETAMRVTVKNLDKLLDLDSTDPKTNLLCQVLTGVADAARSGIDTRCLVDRDTFFELVERILPTASANVAPLLNDNAGLIKGSLLAVLRLADGPMASRINGANLPQLAQGVLLAVLTQELSLADTAAIEKTVDHLLQLAA